MSKTKGNSRPFSLGAKLTIVSFLITAVMLITFIAIISYTTTKQAEAQASADVTDKTAMVVQMLDIFDKELRTQIAVYAKILGNNLKQGIVLDPTRTIEVAGIETPILKSGTTDLNLNFSVTDRFVEQTGGNATIFVKKGNDFVRISTSVKKENGDRAIGTLLDHAHPGYASVMEGKSYTGNAILFGKQYITQYDPIKDSDGKVIGILFVGFDFTDSIKQIKDTIRAMKIGQTGYFYAIDASAGKKYGTLMLHPSKEGQNILESKDPNGREFIKEILDSKQGLIRYPWLNSERGETSAREKFVAFYPIKNWNWVIAGGVYADEYTQESRRQILVYVSIGIFFLLVIAVTLYWTMRRQISSPLKIVIDAAKQLATGNLTSSIEVTRKDEIGQLMIAINDIGIGLTTIIKDISSGANSIATESSKIAAGNFDLATRTEAQASSLEETAASMEELASTVKHNADNVGEASQLAASASEVAVQGGSVVMQVVDTMGAINTSAKKIVDIIGVIDSIAFQTNILALNAAVEAARAGDQGRGFAVVATEVRNLAQRSAEAAKQIKTLISDSVEKVDKGSKLVSQAGVTMNEIVNSINRVTNIMAEITAAGREQSQGIAQVNQAITQMDDTTQKNAALVEQAAAASQSLRDQASSLTQMVGMFQLGSMSASTSEKPAIRQTPSARIAQPIKKMKNPASAPVRLAIAKPSHEAKARTGVGANESKEF